MSNPTERRYVSTDKDWLGIVALVCALVFPIAGIVFGHLAMGACRRGEASNESLSKAGLVLAYVFTALPIVAVIAYLVVVMLFLGASGATVAAI